MRSYFFLYSSAYPTYDRCHLQEQVMGDECNLFEVNYDFK